MFFLFLSLVFLDFIGSQEDYFYYIRSYVVFICHVNLNKAPSFVSYAPILPETQRLRSELCTKFEQNGCWNENIRLLRLCMKQKK